jgi:hypothetical protein
LRAADANTLARFDCSAQAGNRPIRPVGHRLFEQRHDHAQRRCALHRRRPRRDGCFQEVYAAFGEIAAPQPNRILPHAECLSDPRTAPAGQGQPHGARPVSFSTITRTGQSRQRDALFVARN